jgi:gliding motility-associated-like protein
MKKNKSNFKTKSFLINFRIIILFLLCSDWQHSFAQSGVWTWMNGTNIGDDLGNYGTINVSAITNIPPARYQAAYWTDLDGNFWMFGGLVSIDMINDLWKFDINTKLWVWVNGPQYASNTAGNYGTKGVPSVNNYPPGKSYGANSWTDDNNDLWLFSGGSISNQNDLWRYHIATNEWTWMNGDNFGSQLPVYGTLGVYDVLNTPGSRNEIKSSWKTNGGNLWLFGGSLSSNSDVQNDLWKYKISTNEWAWIKGSQSGSNIAGNYGTLGIENTNNLPPARLSYTKWKDIDENLYLFAGGNDLSDGFNDVWKYKPTTNNWTWISGTNLISDIGANSGFCKPNLIDIPAGRIENQTASATGCSQAFWSFGGFGNFGANSIYNDLWIFNSENLKWTLTSGSVVPNQLGNYGTMGIANNTNMIPSKGGVCIWTDKNNNLWIFGGFTSNSMSSLAKGNDMWQYEPDTSCFKASLSVNFSIPRPTDTLFCANQSVQYSLPKMKNIQILPTTGVVFNADSSKITFTLSATTTFTLLAEDNGICPGKDTIAFTIAKVADPIADFDVMPNVTPIENPVFQLVNKSTNAIKYEWYYNNTIFSTQTNESKTFENVGTYCFTLVAFNSEGCTDTIRKCGEIVPSISVVLPNSFSPNGDDNNDVFKAIFKNIRACQFQIFDRFGNKVFTTTDPAKGWDGMHKNQKCDIGTYYYSFTYKNYFGKEKLLKGDLTLIR